MRVDIVVTRHPALVELLKEMGMADEQTKVLSHVSNPEEIRGKVVAGVLPLHLASECEAVVSVDLKLKPEDREKELSLEELKERFIGVNAYKVSKMEMEMQTRPKPRF
mgnify:CR=1 FL=1